MNKESLLKSRDDIKAKFEELKAQATEAQARVEELNQEMIKLQGEYRHCNKLLEEFDTPVDEAGVIDVEPTLKEMDKNNGKS